ncbi:MAG: tripartite tricarboxylate transporter TctB family protein [bacterium]
MSVHSTKGLDPHLGDIFSGAMVVLLGLVLRFWAIPRYIKYNIKVAVLAPESFPAAFSLMLILLGVILLTQGWLQYRTKKLVHKAEGQSSELKKITMKPVSFVVLLVAFIYVNLLYPIGYPLATVLLIVVLFKFLGGKENVARNIVGHLYQRSYLVVFPDLSYGSFTKRTDLVGGECLWAKY